MFIDIAKQMNLPGKDFTRPPHVVDALIDKATGLLAPDGAPKDTTMNEVFIEGTQPVDVAPKPGDVTEGSSVTGTTRIDPRDLFDRAVCRPRLGLAAGPARFLLLSPHIR